MDRFRPPSPEIVKAYCCYCQGEIYAGEDVYEILGDIVHEQCLSAYAGGLKAIEEVLR
jgi:hypothetical protein